MGSSFAACASFFSGCSWGVSFGSFAPFLGSLAACAPRELGNTCQASPGIAESHSLQALQERDCEPKSIRTLK